MANADQFVNVFHNDFHFASAHFNYLNQTRCVCVLLNKWQLFAESSKIITPVERQFPTAFFSGHASNSPDSSGPTPVDICLSRRAWHRHLGKGKSNFQHRAEQITQQKTARSGNEKEFSAFILAKAEEKSGDDWQASPQKAYAVHVCGINQS